MKTYTLKANIENRPYIPGPTECQFQEWYGGPERGCQRVIRAAKTHGLNLVFYENDGFEIIDNWNFGKGGEARRERTPQYEILKVIREELNPNKGE